MTTTDTAPLLSADFLREKFNAALAYHDYASTGNNNQQAAWRAVYDAASLTPQQTGLLQSFTREINILVSSGVWCGDCVQQCPLLARIAEANPDKVHLRFVDRDEHADLANRIRICAGLRVPTAIFMAEDFEFISLLGDKTLTRYRILAEQSLGPACPLPGAPVPPDERAAVLHDWLNEVERSHILCRLSARLRQIHND